MSCLLPEIEGFLQEGMHQLPLEHPVVSPLCKNPALKYPVVSLSVLRGFPPRWNILISEETAIEQKVTPDTISGWTVHGLYCCSSDKCHFASVK